MKTNETHRQAAAGVGGQAPVEGAAGAGGQASSEGGVVAPSGTDYSRFSTGELSRCVDQLHGIHNAALAELFSVVCVLHRRNDFVRDGAKDAASWLQVRLGLPYRTAARWAEVALALQELPHLRAAFYSGCLSLDKVAAALPLASPQSDRQVAEEAARMTVTALEAAARRRRQATVQQEHEARKQRRVWWSWRNGGTMMRLTADLPALQGARLTAVLERTAAQLPAADQDGKLSLAQRRADALAALASVKIASDADQDRATVMVHVDLDTLRTGVGSAWTEQGALLSAQTLQELLCDSRLKALIEDPDGKPLGVGRTRRTAPPWMRQAAKVRDKTCCFPGCDRTDFLVGHHQQEWGRHLGETELDNLPLLCSIHHPLIHHQDWHITGSPSQGLVFVGPNGRVRDGPPPLDYDVKRWLWEDLYRPSPEQMFGSS